MKYLTPYHYKQKYLGNLFFQLKNIIQICFIAPFFAVVLNNFELMVVSIRFLMVNTYSFLKMIKHKTMNNI